MSTTLTLSVMRGARQVATLADLRRLNGTRGETVMLLGIDAAGDGGAAHYWWDPSSTSGDDGDDIIVPTSPRGRWRRVQDQAASSTATVAEINALITTLAENGGGVVRLAAGATYSALASSIRLKDGVTLDLNGATLVQDPNVAAFRMVINDDTSAGNDRIAVVNGTLDGGKQNLTNATPWVTGRAYVIGDEVFNQAEVKIYVCTQAGTSATIPTGTGTAIVDGTVRWNYVCPLWVPGADLVYFTRCRDSRVAVTVRNARNDGVIIEGSVDGDDSFSGGNLCHGVDLDVVVTQCTKAGLYLSAAAHVRGRVQADENLFGVSIAASRWCDLEVLARDNAQAGGLMIGRDTRFCTFDVNVDGINTVVEHISSAPLRLHGRIYPNRSTVTVTPNTTGATTYAYWVVAKNAGGEVLAVSTTISGTITNGNAAPDNTIAWAAVTGAASYDVLKRVAGVPALIVNQAGTSYTDLGAATSAYTYARAYTSYGFSDCTITGIVRRGVAVLRKSFRNKLDLTLHEAGAAADVSSPHAIDLQGASDNRISRCTVVDGVGAGIALESYTEPDFGVTTHSTANVVEHNTIIDTRGTPVTFSIATAAGSTDNVVRRNFSNVAMDLVETDNEVYENTGPDGAGYRFVGLANHADDVAAAAGGVAIGGAYRTGSAVKVRVA